MLQGIFIYFSHSGVGEAAPGERCSAKNYLCWRESRGHLGQRAGGDGSMEGAAELLRGQSCPGHLSHRQGPVFFSGARKLDVDGRHHGTNRMGRTQV